MLARTRENLPLVMTLGATSMRINELYNLRTVVAPVPVIDALQDHIHGPSEYAPSSPLPMVTQPEKGVLKRQLGSIS
jgi:hypothetical protein